MQEHKYNIFSLEDKVYHILMKYSLEFDDRKSLQIELVKLFRENRTKCMACEKTIKEYEALVFCADCGL